MKIHRKNTKSAAILLILTALVIIWGKEETKISKEQGMLVQITDEIKQHQSAWFNSLNSMKNESAKMYERLETLAQYNALFANYPDISEDVKKQLILFAYKSDMWRNVFEESDRNGVISYTVYDLDRDGLLELISETEQGRLHFVWHDYYRADITDKTVITLEQAYHEGEASSHRMNEPELNAYEDAESGNIYYAVTLWSWDPDSHNNIYVDGFFYLENDILKREDIRYRIDYAKTDVDEYYTLLPSKTALNKTAYEKLYTDFIQGMTLKKVQMSWFEPEGNENLTQTEILEMLIKSYVGGAGLVSKENIFSS